MAASAAKSVGQALGKLLVEEAKFLYGVEDKVEELHQELAWMQGFLQDVDKRQHQEELIRMWVSQVRDLAYESQDTVEKFIHKVSAQRRGSVYGFVKRAACIMANARTIHEVGSEIDNLTMKISKLNGRLVSYGVKITHAEDSQSVSRMRDMRQTYSDMVDKDIIKREADTSKMVAELLGNSTNVVGIVGMGGLGKSTLAREVYGSHDLKGKFNCFAWVYVSQHPQMRIVLEGIYRALVKGEADLTSLSEGELCDKVNEVLKERRCLVVLDDIWYKESWHLMKRAFSSIMDSSTSKILLTSRNGDVVKQADPKAFILKPNTLNDEESWTLLRKKAFPRSDDNVKINPKMKESGARMLKHCGGLPIAIISLGGILATRNTVEGWKAVERNVSIFLTKGGAMGQNETIEEMGTTQVLEMSYNDLPFYLKPCFLCLGNFPEDTEISTDTLYQLWQAEGLIREPEENEADDYVCSYEIAEQYLNELVKRCMVDVGRVYGNGRIETCRMHDVMRDLCLNKSKEERFLEVCKVRRVGDEEGRASAQRQVKKFHRVVVPVQVDQHSEKLCNWMQENALQPRSAFMYLPATRRVQDSPLNEMWLLKMSRGFGLLRVLLFERGVVRELPNGLQSCIHLRYLKVGFIEGCKVSPVVWKLNYLETLDLRDSQRGVVIPNKLWKLKRLVHLYLPNYNYELVKGEKLKLSEPRQMETLVNFKLETFDVKDLREMKNLRVVSFKTGIMTDVETLRLVLHEIVTSRLLTNPVSDLEIDARGINEDFKILGSNPHANIERLTVWGAIKIERIYRILFPSTLHHLCLCKTEIEGDCIPHLKIPGLKVLKLREKATKGSKIVFSSESFPQLRKVELEWPEGSQPLEVEGELPESCQLTIWCQKHTEERVASAIRDLKTSAARRPDIFGRG